MCVCVGERPGTRYVLLYEASGGDRDLFSPWQRVRTKRGNLSLQVRVLMIKSCNVQCRGANIYRWRKIMRPMCLAQSCNKKQAHKTVESLSKLEELHNIYLHLLLMFALVLVGK